MIRFPLLRTTCGSTVRWLTFWGVIILGLMLGEWIAPVGVMP